MFGCGVVEFGHAKAVHETHAIKGVISYRFLVSFCTSASVLPFSTASP